ncbi:MULTISPECIES: serine/threonine-protein kinase [unclassified Nocardia]|uniref:serine/threonine-protein kinase n=1 Tax=unclassified Nocardia TaxID=2637762 RepID=UPI003425B4C9
MGKTWFGHYRLDRLLGSGGTGQVWLARDTVADRAVALKVLDCSHATDPTCRLRFTREARLAAQVPGPHRVPIHTFGELDGRLYIDMEFIEGTDVSALLREAGPLDPARAVAIIAQTAMALDAMHRVGLVHRDVKPSNIMVGPTGFVHLIDFGIAHRIDQPAITAHGNVVGTLAYMAPERFDGIADARADQYSLACVLYECLTGQRPFGNVDSPQQLRAHLLTAPPSAAALNPAVPASLDTAITRAMAKDPNQRYSSAGEFAATAYAAATGREASTVEIAASTVPTTHVLLEPCHAAEGVSAEPADEPMRAGAMERLQIAESAAGEWTRDAGSARAGVRTGPAEASRMQDVAAGRESMGVGGAAEGMRDAVSAHEPGSVGGAVGEWTRDAAPAPEPTWVGGAGAESTRDAELWWERAGWWGVGPGHAAVAIAALVALIGLALWLGRPGGETSYAAPSSARTTPTVPKSLAPTGPAQAASPNAVIPGVGQPCEPGVDGNVIAADGTPLVCRTVGGGIANWAPAQPFGDIPDGQQSEPTVVGNGNPHVNSSANGESGNDKPNKGKPGHGGRAKPGK